jgi:hypothetical protein
MISSQSKKNVHTYRVLLTYFIAVVLTCLLSATVFVIYSKAIIYSGRQVDAKNYLYQITWWNNFISEFILLVPVACIYFWTKKYIFKSPKDTFANTIGLILLVLFVFLLFVSFFYYGISLNDVGGNDYGQSLIFLLTIAIFPIVLNIISRISYKILWQP